MQMYASTAGKSGGEFYTRIVDLQVGFLVMPVAGGVYQTRLLSSPSSIRVRESTPRPHGGSNRGFGGCVIFGGGVGEPPNRQGAALFNQGIDLLNHGVASKTLSGVRLELARRRWQ